ncbi:CHRD domain-containing protein [Flavobacterium aquiphilum]|uniref:CHRD domain-containing protein n=1 Tax=Flavobacterium aquiphilum TaxID=3003261 RepID=UPI0024801C72|nr:CHRD domain-containing protein [Flavobacterium aquiphilum]
MKSVLNFSAILLLFFIGNSCSSSDDNSTPSAPSPVISTFTATLGPPTGVTSTASGSATLKLNETAKTYEITVNYTGLTPIHGHIHSADGAVQLPFPDATVASSPFTYSAAINDTQITQLMAGTDYVNLHTTAYPAGEISGVLTKTGTTGGGTGGGGGGY